MKKITKSFILFFLLLFNMNLFAQLGGADETEDPTGAPINNNIIILVIFGVIYAFYSFTRRTSNTK